MNRSKTCYFAGFAGDVGSTALAQKIGAAQVRHITDFVSLKGKKIPFNSSCKHGDSADNIIDGCYALDVERNPADKAVSDTFWLSFMMRKAKDDYTGHEAAEEQEECHSAGGAGNRQDLRDGGACTVRSWCHGCRFQ